MLNIIATIDDVPVTLSTRNELEAFYRFIGTYLRLTSQPPVTSSPNILPPMQHSVPEPSNTETQPKQPDKRPFEGRNPPDGERIVDYIEKVLNDYPKGISSAQILHRMMQLGWQTTSTNPMRLVQIKLYEDKERFCQNSERKWQLCRFVQNENTTSIKSETSDLLSTNTLLDVSN